MSTLRLPRQESMLPRISILVSKATLGGDLKTSFRPKKLTKSPQETPENSTHTALYVIAMFLGGTTTLISANSACGLEPASFRQSMPTGTMTQLSVASANHDARTARLLTLPSPHHCDIGKLFWPKILCRLLDNTENSLYFPS